MNSVGDVPRRGRAPSRVAPSKARFRALTPANGFVERVVQAIEREIVGGRLPLGARLPSEREFAERLGVSRTVVREAVRILVTNGLLATRHGIGTTVRAVTPEEVTRPLTLFIRTCPEPVDVEHLHQVRSMLEVGIASLAAKQSTDEDVEDLRRICAAMDANAASPPKFAEKDAEFHRRLAQATHNPLLVLLLDSIRDLMAEVRTLVARQHGLFERVMPTHLEIVACVASHDGEGARRAMREHLAIALTIQRELLKERSANSEEVQPCIVTPLW